MLTLDSSWKETLIATGNISRRAYVHELTPEEANTRALYERGGRTFQEMHIGSVIAEGGALVLHQRDPSVIGVDILFNGARSPRLELLPEQLWYLPNCSFEDSLDCLPFFGFPSDRAVTFPQESLTKCRRHIERLTIGRTLALECVSSRTINLKLTGGLSITKDEALRILDFNTEEFAAKRAKWEHREYVQIFTGGYIILGAF